MDYYLMAFQKYAVFTGRARRKEYWMFFLFNFIVAFAVAIVDAIGGLGFLSIVYSLAIVCPGSALWVRRLHDTGRSAWWILIIFVPVLGGLAMLYFLVQDSQAGSNEYGPNPKEEPPTLASGPLPA